MQVHTVDVAVIGAGTAGLSAQRAARRAGKSALLIDRGPLGTTCARVGCMPSKLLIAAGEAAHAVTAAQLFGVYAEAPRIDGPAVLARVQRERDRFVSFVLADCEQLMARGELILGEARVVAPGLLQVGEEVQVRFGALVVATGTVAQIPGAYAALPRELLLTNDSVFELKALPASVLVVGTGAIGLELGQALHRLGVRVTIVGNRGVVGPLQDTTVKAAALAALRRELDVQPSYQFEAIAANVSSWIVLTDPELRVEVDNKPGVLASVAAAIAESDSNIENVEYGDRGAMSAIIVFTIEVRNRKHLADVMRRVRRLLKRKALVRRKAQDVRSRLLMLRATGHWLSAVCFRQRACSSLRFKRGKRAVARLRLTQLSKRPQRNWRKLSLIWSARLFARRSMAWWSPAMPSPAPRSSPARRCCG